MEALSGVFYDHINRWFFDYIHDDMDQETLNRIVDERAKQYENFIAWVYNQGSADTKFWKHANKITTEHLTNNPIWDRTKKHLNKTNTKMTCLKHGLLEKYHGTYY